MNGLNEADLAILQFYVKHGNRERYWNYLAQHEGSDGFGLLALGVVRNDNMPGAVANIYAQNHARQHDHRELSERAWEAFGVDLMRRDLALRSKHVEHGDYALALNLPAKDVQQAHADALDHAHLSHDAWTPNQLFDAAHRYGGEPEMEKVWHQMLDNHRWGLDRSFHTLAGLAHRYNDGQLDALAYTRDLGVAYAEAIESRPTTDPDTIGTQSLYYAYDARSRGWNMVVETSPPNALGLMSQPEPLIRPVTDPQTLARLDDARAVRMERQAKAARIAPGDPYVTLVASPFVFAGTSSPKPAQGLDPSGRDLYAALEQRLPGASEDRLMQFTAACHTHRITADNLAVAHLDEANMRMVFTGSSYLSAPASIDLAAPPPPVPQSIQLMHAYDQQQAQMMSQMQARHAQANLPPQGPMLAGP